MSKKKEIFEHVRKSGFEAANILRKYNYCRLHFECRTGKTLTSLLAAENAGFKNIFVITSKKAITDFTEDFETFRSEFSFSMTITNYEQLHKFRDLKDYDLVIIDEVHMVAADPKPKPSRRAKFIGELAYKKSQLHMSATPAPEGDGQIIWQLKVCKHAPLSEMSFRNFVRNYIRIRTNRTSAGFDTVDYKLHKNDGIKKAIAKYTLIKRQEDIQTFEQSDAKKFYHTVDMEARTYDYMGKIARDKGIIFDNGDRVLCETITSERMKQQQLCGGVLIAESAGKSRKDMILDTSKAAFVSKIAKKYGKVVLAYKFKAELQLLKEYFHGTITEDRDKFKNENYKFFAAQIKANSQGIDLSYADAMFIYSLDHSAVTYLQIIERLKHNLRKKPIDVHFFTTKRGIDKEILKAVQKKENYTSTHYRRDKANLAQYKGGDGNGTKSK